VATDGPASDGLIADDSVTDGSVTDGAVADGSVADDAVADDAVADDAVTDDAGDSSATEAPARDPHDGPVARAVGVAVVVACVAFTAAQLAPELLLANTTPNGGDMGAHVWGPAFLRDHLLPSFQLRGWTQDWYAGFPAYHFYMVVPSLLIVALDLLLPYGVAFKLVTVAGVVALPVAAWALGRGLRLPEPAPPLLAVAAVGFLFDRNFTIYGGNLASTLAGEFHFSISLALALLALAVVARGLETGRHRALAAVLLALTVLCHVIPGLFAAAGAVVLLAVRPSARRARWLLVAGGAGAALSAWWVLPFVARRSFMNDMGWEKRTDVVELLLPGRIGAALVRWTGGTPGTPVADDLTWVLALALAGAVLAVALRRRGALALVALAAVVAVAVVVVPQGRLWNARLLPFWYLLLRVLAAYAVAEAIRAAAGAAAGAGLARRATAIAVGGPLAALGLALVVVGLPLGALPGARVEPDPVTGVTTTRWLAFETTDRSFLPFWVQWNYSGYERKPAWPELRDLIDTMDQVGADRGCGRALWEYDGGLDRYGTPMALMLLPHWTDGCIGSMEGLYFEASTTTPYHFMTQSELSAAPSRPQRDLPYGPLDVARGVDHLQLLGVRYYLASSAEAVAQAEAEPRLTEVATSGPWHAYEVADAPLVAPLDEEPAVLTGPATAGGEPWLEVASGWYAEAGPRSTVLVADGPDAWARVGDEGAGEALADLPPRPLPPVAVTDVEIGDDTVSFDVDRIGVPVLVKVSAFPNWRADGAEGPYRATPNLMVVVPTERHVELRYGATSVEWVSWGITVAGALVLAAPAVLARRRRHDGARAAGADAAPAPATDDAAGDPTDGRPERAAT
jgi:hypothetical protein